MRKLAFPVLVLTLLTLAAACGDDGGGGGSSATSATTAPSATTLEGTDWRLVDPAALAGGAGPTAVTARFVKGSVTGTSGCNTYRGPYSVRGDELTVGPDIATTAMACEPGPTAVESAYLDRLRRVAAWSVDGETLRLSEPGGAVLLEFEAAGGADDLAGRWTVTGIYTGSAIEGVRGDADLTAELRDGTLTGDGGCNTFTSSYEVDGSSIRIEPALSTMRACEDDTLTTQEQQYLAALELARTFSVEGDRLTLNRSDGGIAVTFERE